MEAALGFRNLMTGLLRAGMAAFGALGVPPEIKAKISEAVALRRQARMAFGLGLTNAVLELCK